MLRAVVAGAALWWCAQVGFGAAREDDAVRAVTAALRANQLQEALKLARAARAAAPRDPRLAVLEGMALTRLGREKEALFVLQGAVRIAPDYVPAVEAAADLEYRLGDPLVASHLQHLLSLRPGEPTAHAMLGALAWKRRDCNGAIEHFRQARAAIATQPDALREYGACLMRAKQPAEAAEVFRQWSALRPEERRARYALAAALTGAGRGHEAVAALEALANGAKQDAIALELTSEAQEAMGETPSAVETLRRAVLADPRNPDLYLDFAALAFTHQSFDVGIDMVNAGLTQLPDSGALYLARGVLYVQLGQYEKADADFEKAERLDPKRASGSAARSLSQIQQNNPGEALATVRAQLKSRPNDAFPHYVLAELLSRQGAQAGSAEFREALWAAREAVRLKPDFVLARDVLSRLYLENGETAKAIEQCRLALKDDPNDEIALYRLIRALQSRGGAEAGEVPSLLERFKAVREENRERQAREGQYRLVEAEEPAGH